MTIKRIISIILTAVFALSVPLLSLASQDEARIYGNGDSGEAVLRIQMRLRELGYFCHRPTGMYLKVTVEAVRAFQERCGAYGAPISIDGKMGPESMKRLFAPDAPRVRIPDSVHMPRGPMNDPLAAKGQLVPWSEVKEQLTEGEAYTLIDCNTGDEFSMVFSGGLEHAEMKLKSSADEEVFRRICGGEYNFLKRPVVMRIGGIAVAASIQCMPHGGDGTAMGGIICVFFSGSVSHIAGMPDAEHEAVVRKAAGM